MQVYAKRGTHRIKVTRLSYETIFKKRGYVLDEEQNPVIDETQTEHKIEMEEIPISDMSKEQLMEFAKAHGIDTSSAKRTSDARRIIQEAVRKENM